jgi:hypothetical protein
MGAAHRFARLSVLPRRQRFYTGLLILVLLGSLGGMAILWSVDPETYRRVIYILGVPPVMVRGAWYGHNPLPFFDLAGVLSWAQCHAQGIDVFVRNPCDPMARLFNYGPGSLLPFGSPDDTLAAGAVLDSVFLLMVALILRPATGGEFAIALLAAFSHAVFLAVERANLDIAIFILVMAGALLPQRRLGGRLAFYATALLGGFIKFYPMALLVLIWRERPRLLLALSMASLVCIAGFLFWYGDDAARALALLPVDDNQTGGPVLPHLLAMQIDMPDVWALLYIFLLAGTLVLSILALSRLGSLLQPIDWNQPSYMLMLTGMVMTLGCFLTGTSYDYRFIFLLPVLPGLMALRRAAPDRAARRILGMAVGLVCICLWYYGVCLSVPYFLGVPLLPILYVHELLWWALIVILAAILIGFAGRSPFFDRMRHDSSLQT